MRTPTRLFVLSLCMGAVLPLNFAHAQPDEEFSRSELFSVMKQQEHITGQYALAPDFSFPDSTRDGSVFGVDFSHHITDACHCTVPWTALAANKVAFVYVKATQGSGYTDPTALSNLQLISHTTMSSGAYHFLTTDPVEQQVAYFLAFYRKAGKLQLAPSLDLEWFLGPMRPDCPTDARVKVKRQNGSTLIRCDLWGFVGSQQILKAVNQWTDSIKSATGRTPLLYTNAEWWKARIGAGSKASLLHTSDIWIADYSSSGKATEKPNVPGSVGWRYWQFTEKAVVNASSGIRMDASIAR